MQDEHKQLTCDNLASFYEQAYTPLHPLTPPYIPLQVASPAAMARARSARERSATILALDGVLQPGLG